MKLNVITLLLAFAGLIYIFMHFQLPWTPLRIAGLAIGLPSAALLVLARIQLGAAFAIRAKASNLVTTGIYSRIRNPIYVFGGLAITGLFLYINPKWLLLLIVLVPLQIIRVRQEEKVLAEKFGEEYQRYKSRTWF